MKFFCKGTVSTQKRANFFCGAQNLWSIKKFLAGLAGTMLLLGGSPLMSNPAPFAEKIFPSTYETVDIAGKNRVVQNNSVIYQSNATIVGNNNEIHGDNNIITGNNNKIYGNNIILTGNNNVIQGNNIVITGNNNTTYGQNNRSTGNNNRHYN